MNKKQFEAYFKTEIEPSIDQTDKPALREAWNNTIDGLCKDGSLPDRARDWSHPKRFYWPSDRPSFEKSLKSYIRKTKDEFEVQGDYGHGYECVTTEETKKEAIQRLKEYRENEPGIAFKYVRKRVKKEVKEIR